MSTNEEPIIYSPRPGVVREIPAGAGVWFDHGALDLGVRPSHGAHHWLWRWRNRRNARGVMTQVRDSTGDHYGCRVCSWTLDVPA